MKKVSPGLKQSIHFYSMYVNFTNVSKLGFIIRISKNKVKYVIQKLVFLFEDLLLSIAAVILHKINNAQLKV